MYQKSHSSYRRLKHITQDEQEWFTGILRNAECCLYGTFTFAQEADSQQAKICFDSFINSCSQPWPRRGDNIGFVVAEEVAVSGLSNFKVKRHLHAVMMSNLHLCAEAIQGRWSRYVGNALVEPYDISKNGI